MADDVYFANVPLLLNCNNTGSPTTFTDLSYSPKTVTAGGGAAQSATQSKFGGASLRTDGAGDYVSVTSTTDFDFGVGDFAVELWARFDTVSPAQNKILITKGWTSAAAAAPWMIIMIPSGSVNFYASTDSSNWNVVSALVLKAAPVADTWYHFAVTREAGVFRAFCDGVLTSSYTSAGSIQVTSGNVMIGGSTVSGDSMAGYIDDVRITKGVARYTGTFSVPTEEFAVPPPDSLTAELAAPAGFINSYFGSFANLTAPMQALSFYTGFQAAMTAPSPKLTASFGSTISLTAPAGLATMSFHDATGENAAFLTAPAGQLSARFGWVAALSAPAATMAGSLTSAGLLHADLVAPKGVMSATGTGSPYALTAALTAPVGRMAGYFGMVASITGPMGTVVSNVSSGAVLRGAMEAPLFELTASFSAGGVFHGDLISPVAHPTGKLLGYLISPMGQLTAIGHAVVTATYEAYAINLKHVPVRGVEPVDEVTRYTSFPFTHIVRYKNSYFGVGSDGNLYLLEGTTDNATPISWAWKTALDDFKTPNKKTLYSVNFSGRVGPAATITAYLGESGSNVYSYTTPRDALPQNYRQLFGKGMKDRYYALGATGDGDLMLDDMTPNHAVLARKI